MEGDNKNVLVFATGEKEKGRGGSGFLELVEFTSTTAVRSFFVYRS